MSDSYSALLEGNIRWANNMLKFNPNYFEELSLVQKPEFLWIGCSDSRVSANEITNTKPGEVFVHRNIANQVVHTDMNLLSVLQYAVEVLKVKHIIVCGHYGCGGIAAACSNKQYGLIDNWLRHIKDVYRFHQQELDALQDPKALEHRLVELNVIEQVRNVCKTTIVQNAWKTGEYPSVHGWVYDIRDGIIDDLDISVKDNLKMEDIYHFNH